VPNAREQLDRRIALTRDAGLAPVSPGDFAIPLQPSTRLFGHAIRAVDEKMMNERSSPAPLRPDRE